LKQYDEAIKSYQKAIALRPDSLRPHMNLGMVYWSMGQLEKAIPEFQEALKCDSTSVPAHLALGRLFLQKKQYHLAEPSLETATRLNPKESRQGFLDLIQIQLVHNDTARARFFLNRLFEFFPGDPDGIILQKKIESPASPAQTVLP
jgi:tetratricopeptide (TPR) repeat protein